VPALAAATEVLPVMPEAGPLMKWGEGVVEVNVPNADALSPMSTPIWSDVSVPTWLAQQRRIWIIEARDVPAVAVRMQTSDSSATIVWFFMVTE
jgi:hypothetical protein